MKAEDFNNLKIGDIVYIVINTGACGIFKYQYCCIATCHKTGENSHVFLSEYLLSTVCILVNNVKGSRRLKNIFYTEKEAKQHKDFLIKKEKETYDY